VCVAVGNRLQSARFRVLRCLILTGSSCPTFRPFVRVSASPCHLHDLASQHPSWQKCKHSEKTVQRHTSHTLPLSMVYLHTDLERSSAGQHHHTTTHSIPPPPQTYRLTTYQQHQLTSPHLILLPSPKRRATQQQNYNEAFIPPAAMLGSRHIAECE
jgi:hypothetical protein